MALPTAISNRDGHAVSDRYGDGHRFVILFSSFLNVENLSLDALKQCFNYAANTEFSPIMPSCVSLDSLDTASAFSMLCGRAWFHNTGVKTCLHFRIGLHGFKRLSTRENEDTDARAVRRTSEWFLAVTDQAMQTTVFVRNMALV